MLLPLVLLTLPLALAVCTVVGAVSTLDVLTGAAGTPPKPESDASRAREDHARPPGN